MEIIGKNINLRTANLEDAQFILSLRLKRGEFLSQTSSKIEDQVEWLKHYKERELDGLEYYFIAESKVNNVRIGVVRIYNIDLSNNSFTFGSFIIDKQKANKYSSIEIMTNIYDFAFNVLKLENCLFDCRINNEVVNNFYIRYGAEIISKDEINIYYKYDKEIFDKNCDKYLHVIESYPNQELASS